MSFFSTRAASCIFVLLNLTCVFCVLCSDSSAHVDAPCIIVARLETANHQFGTKMLISLNVVKLMSPAYAESLRCVDCVRPKGVAIGIQIFTSDQIRLLKNPFADTKEGRREKYLPLRAADAFQALYKQGFEAYFRGDWVEAVEVMTKCAEMDPDDHPSKVILEQIAKRGGKWDPAFWVSTFGAKGSGRALTAK